MKDIRFITKYDKYYISMSHDIYADRMTTNSFCILGYCQTYLFDFKLILNDYNGTVNHRGIEFNTPSEAHKFIDEWLMPRVVMTSLIGENKNGK